MQTSPVAACARGTFAFRPESQDGEEWRRGHDLQLAWCCASCSGMRQLFPKKEGKEIELAIKYSFTGTSGSESATARGGGKWDSNVRER